MTPTFVKRGDFVIETLDDGVVRITRQSTAQAVELTISEWGFLLQVADLIGLPTSPPITQQRFPPT